MLLKKNKIFLFFLLFACSGTNESATVVDYYKKAKESQIVGNIKNTISIYKKIIAISPKSKYAYISLYEIANIYKQASAYKEALKYFKLYLELIKIDSNRMFEINNEIGDIYFKHYKDYKKALKYYSNAMDKSVDNKQIFISSFNISKSYFNLLNFEQAVKFLRKTKFEYSDDIDKYLFQEVLYYLSYSEIMFLKETKDGYISTGYGYFDQNDIDGILKNINACINIDEFSKYGLMCKYLDVDFLIENDKKLKALEILKNLREYYPNPNVIEYRIKQLERGN